MLLAVVLVPILLAFVNQKLARRDAVLGTSDDVPKVVLVLTVHENHALLGSSNKSVDHPNR